MTLRQGSDTSIDHGLGFRDPIPVTRHGMALCAEGFRRQWLCRAVLHLSYGGQRESLFPC